MDRERLTTLAAEIVAAHVANNSIPAGEVPGFLRSICATLVDVATLSPITVPAVSIEGSVDADHLTCLICGRRHRTLTRHLQTAHAMSPGEYRSSFNLPEDYPMNAATYSALRGRLAKAVGLGNGRHSRQRKAL